MDKSKIKIAESKTTHHHSSKKKKISEIRTFFSNKYNSFRWWVFFNVGRKCKICADGNFYPFYGLAPHYHSMKDSKSILSTEILSKDHWPENFIPDKKDSHSGIYYCTNPECKNYFGNKK